MSIVDNRRARYEYHLEEEYEAGMVLQGWEVKAIRSGQVQLTGSYVVVKDGELFLIGCQINPLRTASTHVRPEAQRSKKLLLAKQQIRRLIGKTEQKGYTLVPLDLHFKGGLVKCQFALGKGKANHDKRETEKKRDWEREGAADETQDLISQGLSNAKSLTRAAGSAADGAAGRRGS